MEEWLASLMPWGTEVILWFQAQSSPGLDAVFTGFTFLGNIEFYIFVLPIVFWCIHKRVGIGLAYVAMLSAWLNDALKYVYALPRPTHPDLRTPLPEISPSFPSGHAQNGVAVWGYLAYRVRHWAFTIAAIVIILGISLSRIVLCVHFPQDVIGGALIGLVFLALYVRLAPPVGRWLARRRASIQLAAAIVAPLVLIFVHPADAEGFYPAEGAITPMAALLGLGVGLIMEKTWVRFRVDGPWWQRALRYLAGLVVVAMFYVGPRLLLPEAMSFGLEATVRLLRYGLLGWAVSFLAPWLFVKTGLAEQERQSPGQP